MSAYETDSIKNTCTCKDYMYRQIKIPLVIRSCKHLKRLRGELKVNRSPVYYPNKDTEKFDGFQLISETVPRGILDRDKWKYSIKYDGIRVTIPPYGSVASTRSGKRLIDIGEIFNNTSKYRLDAELYPTSLVRPGHTEVMRILDQNTTTGLSVVVFDIIIDNLKFKDRLRILAQLPGIPSIKYYKIPDNNINSLEKTTTSFKQVGLEGIVVRNAEAFYSNTRSNKNAFKMK